jgi:RNA polymerase sigma-70 factor (ECF subfamily)
MPTINADIILLAKQGNEEAWKELVIQYSKGIWFVSRKYSFSESDREDVVQEVFTRLIQCIGSYDPEISSFSNFLAVIAERTCIDKIRKISRRSEEPFSDQKLVENSSPTFTQDATIHSKETNNLLKNAIDELPADKRLVINLFYFKDLSYAQIARVMNRNEIWVKNSLYRTRKKLKKIITQANMKKKFEKLYKLKRIMGRLKIPPIE